MAMPPRGSLRRISSDLKMKSFTKTRKLPRTTCKLVIWHTEGTAIGGLLTWMWRLKKSLPSAGVELTLASLEIEPFQSPQVCEPEKIYDIRIRTQEEWIAFLLANRSSVHFINYAYKYVDRLGKINPALLGQLTLAGICHADQNSDYHHLNRLDSWLAGIIAVSPRCREKLEVLLPHRRGTIPVLPDWDMPIKAAPDKSQNRSKPLQVLFNGRILNQQKRVFDLPEISRRLAHMRAPVQLTVVGEGSDLPRLRDELGEGRHILYRLLEPRAPWAMEKLLQEHDVFLQTSEFEGASVSLMEAMIAGLVPVVTKTESGTDLLEHGRNALLCPVGDVEAFTDALADLAYNRDRIPKLGREAFKTARASLGKLDYAQGLRKYIESLQIYPVPKAA
jgi:glycosyltransferase involved in cell wall biosynthesis